MMIQCLQTMACEYAILAIMIYIGLRCFFQRNNQLIRRFSHFVVGIIIFQIINIPVRMIDAGLAHMSQITVFVLNSAFMIAETLDRKSTRLNSSHSGQSRMPSSA